MLKQVLVLTFMSTTCLSAASSVRAQDKLTTQWQREQKADPLRGTTYSQFTLAGKFLAPPRGASNAYPTMVARCIPGKDNRGHTNGKFVSGYIYVGAVVDSNVTDNGVSTISIEFRLDAGKLQADRWGRSSDFSAIFFADPACPFCGSGYTTLANLLYGHLTYHKENTSPPVHKVVIGVSEFLAGEVVMQFDMPDPTEVAEACGIVWHK